MGFGSVSIIRIGFGPLSMFAGFNRITDYAHKLHANPDTKQD